MAQNTKVVIPMAGKSKRFGGFLSPKPLIEIDGKPMIEHVVDYFPRNTKFIFICLDEHLKSTPMKQVLERVAPDGIIISVPEKMLRGPAYTCLAAFEHVDDDEPLFINYCDLIQQWDEKEFLKKIDQKKPDGAIVTFKGFHPASLGDTHYCYLKVNKKGYVTDLKEKQSFTDNRMEEPASTGTYYFASGKLFKKYVKKLVSDDRNAVNGEFYMSLPYLLMLKDKLKILSFDVEKFICLGTPRDYGLYRFWSEFFESNSPRFIQFDNIDLKMTNIFPLAGPDREFKKMGYDMPNFMIPVMNRTLIEYSFRSNPRGIRNLFIGLEKDKGYFKQLDLFNQHDSEVHFLEKPLNGNAASIYEVRDKVDQKKPLCICGSTYILDYNERRMLNLMEKSDIDIILFSHSHHECVLRDPNFHTYVKLKNNIEVEHITEKKGPISDNPYLDQAMTGTAIFKKGEDLFNTIKMEIDKATGEKLYYLTCINNLLPERKAVIFEVDKLILLSKIMGLKEFTYWQDYFDKRGYHPYSKILQ